MKTTNPGARNYPLLGGLLIGLLVLVICSKLKMWERWHFAPDGSGIEVRQATFWEAVREIPTQGRVTAETASALPVFASNVQNLIVLPLVVLVALACGGVAAWLVSRLGRRRAGAVPQVD